MTTAISLLAHGDLVAAWQANQAGVFVGLAGFIATIWLTLIAVGPTSRWSVPAENVALSLTVASVALVMVRYVFVVGAAIATGLP